mgnify:CR=1 FL=1
MELLSERLHIQRSSLVIWDDTVDQARIIAAMGMSREEMQKGRYSLGEGITGRVMQTGRPMIIPDISKEPEFLNRTGSRQIKTPPGTPSAQAISFICVPVKDGERQVGAISVDKPYVNDLSLAADARLLSIIAGSIAHPHPSPGAA